MSAGATRARATRPSSGYAARRARARQVRGGRLSRGQALVEFSFVIIVLMFIVVGVTDIATLLDEHESLVYAARQGARTGAVIGPVANADCAIVGAVHASLINQPNTFTLNDIYIYQATASASGARGGAVYDEYPGNADCVAGTITQPAIATNWPSTTRNNTPFSTSPVIDSLGVELDYSYTFQFNLLGVGPFSGVDYAVFQMNPAGLPTPIPTPAA